MDEVRTLRACREECALSGAVLVFAHFWGPVPADGIPVQAGCAVDFLPSLLAWSIAVTLKETAVPVSVATLESQLFGFPSCPLRRLVTWGPIVAVGSSAFSGLVASLVTLTVLCVSFVAALSIFAVVALVAISFAVVVAVVALVAVPFTAVVAAATTVSVPARGALSACIAPSVRVAPRIAAS